MLPKPETGEDDLFRQLFIYLKQLEYLVRLINCSRTSLSELGLGGLKVERSFFAKNERNDQERSHRSEKNERLECVLKNIGTISKRTEWNGTGIA